jgi:hypothetical protein
MEAICRYLLWIRCPLKRHIGYIPLRLNPSAKVLVEQARASAQIPTKRLWRSGCDVQWREPADYCKLRSDPMPKSAYQRFVSCDELRRRAARSHIVHAKCCHKDICGQKLLSFYKLERLTGIYARPGDELPPNRSVEISGKNGGDLKGQGRCLMLDTYASHHRVSYKKQLQLRLSTFIQDDAGSLACCFG